MEIKFFSLFKNELIIHHSTTIKEQFMKIDKNGLNIIGVKKDIYDNRCAYLDRNGYLHVKGSVSEEENGEEILPSPTSGYEAGSLDTNTGAIKDSASSIRTSDYMEISSDYAYTIKLPQTVKYFRAHFYDSNKTFISCTDDGEVSSVMVTPPANAKYMKFKFSSSDENSATALGFASSITITQSKIEAPPIDDGDSGGGSSGDSGDMLYSFGMLADTHIDGDGDDEAYSHSDFKNAIDFLNSKGVAFTCIAGDVGRDGTTSDYNYVKQYFARANHPIYCVKGNHDNYQSSSSTTSGYKTATGCENDYVKEKNGDVFIFLSMGNKDTASAGLDSSKVSWLKTQLSTYKNKRKFLIFHEPIPDTCGNPNNLYWSPMSLSNSNCSSFASAVKADPKLIFMHGHTHFLFNLESKYSNANYYHKSGECYHIHTPSCARPRDTATSTIYNKGEGYLVEVYADKVVFRGFDVTTKALKTSYVYTINLPQS